MAGQRVIGIGGVFFKAADPVKLQNWYRDHLGVDVQTWGGAVFERPAGSSPAGDTPTAWRIAASNDEAFDPSEAPFIINYLVKDLTGLLKNLREEGCNVIGEFDEGEQGKFGWVMDPEGNKIELWEPTTQY